MPNSLQRTLILKSVCVTMVTLCFHKLPIKSTVVSSMSGKHQLTDGPQHTHSEPEVKPQPHTHLLHFVQAVRQKANSHKTGWLWLATIPPEIHINKHWGVFLKKQFALWLGCKVMSSEAWSTQAGDQVVALERFVVSFHLTEVSATGCRGDCAGLKLHHQTNSCTICPFSKTFRHTIK